MYHFVGRAVLIPAYMGLTHETIRIACMQWSKQELKQPEFDGGFA